MRGISVRLVDALEAHFGETHEELAGANAAQDQLVAGLGFTNVVFFPDLPNKVQSGLSHEAIARDLDRKSCGEKHWSKSVIGSGGGFSGPTLAMRWCGGCSL